MSRRELLKATGAAMVFGQAMRMRSAPQNHVLPNKDPWEQDAARYTTGQCIVVDGGFLASGVNS